MNLNNLNMNLNNINTLNNINNINHNLSNINNMNNLNNLSNMSNMQDVASMQNLSSMTNLSNINMNIHYDDQHSQSQHLNKKSKPNDYNLDLVSLLGSNHHHLNNVNLPNLQPLNHNNLLNTQQNMYTHPPHDRMSSSLFSNKFVVLLQNSLSNIDTLFSSPGSPLQEYFAANSTPYSDITDIKKTCISNVISSLVLSASEIPTRKVNTSNSIILDDGLSDDERDPMIPSVTGKRKVDRITINNEWRKAPLNLLPFVVYFFNIFLLNDSLKIR